MTFWAKLLTIICCFLSLVFATMSGVIFAKRQDFRDGWEKEKAARALSEQKLQDDISVLSQTLDDVKGKLADAQKAHSAATLELDKTRGERDTALRQFNDETAKSQAFQNTLNQYNAKLDLVVTQNADFVKANKALEAENSKRMAELTTANVQISQLQKSKTDLEKERKDLQVQLADARDSLAFNAEVFKELAARNIEAAGVIHDLQSLPDIRGRVAAVDAKTRSVVLNVGRKQGVMKNYTFTVFRGSQFVGNVSIFEVSDTLSAGHIEVERAPVQVGDSAWTRLP